MRLISLLAVLAFAAPAIAQETPTEAPQDKKICRAVQSTGSILGAKRECHTKAEWTKIRAANQENVDRGLDNRPRLRGNGEP
jgi:hypothetical protein